MKFKLFLVLFVLVFSFSFIFAEEITPDSECSYNYDSLNRISSIICGGDKISYSYFGNSEDISKIVYADSSVDEFDKEGNLVAQKIYSETGKLVSNLIYSYDSNSNLLSNFDSVSGIGIYYSYCSGSDCPAGNIKSVTRSNGEIALSTNYQYDSEGRFISYNDLNTKEEYTYSGDLLVSKKVFLSPTSTEYFTLDLNRDANNNIIKVAANSPSMVESPTLNFSYSESSYSCSKPVCRDTSNVCSSDPESCINIEDCSSGSCVDTLCYDYDFVDSTCTDNVVDEVTSNFELDNSVCENNECSAEPILEDNEYFYTYNDKGFLTKMESKIPDLFGDILVLDFSYNDLGYLNHIDVSDGSFYSIENDLYGVPFKITFNSPKENSLSKSITGKVIINGKEYDQNIYYSLDGSLAGEGVLTEEEVIALGGEVVEDPIIREKIEENTKIKSSGSSSGGGFRGFISKIFSTSENVSEVSSVGSLFVSTENLNEEEKQIILNKRGAGIWYVVLGGIVTILIILSIIFYFIFRKRKNEN